MFKNSNAIDMEKKPQTRLHPCEGEITFALGIQRTPFAAHSGTLICIANFKISLWILNKERQMDLQI